MTPKSSLNIQVPDRGFSKDVDKWLEEKQELDGAEGLWRVHDGLYDFSSFVKNHPGGQYWLEDTKGTDITEPFEVHHISTLPESLLEKFFVRKATTPRHSPFTLKEDGFYKTVKRNVREVLKTVPMDETKRTDLYCDGLLTGTFVFGILATMFWSYGLAILSGICFGLTVIATHNYSHQRQNFRVYYADLCLENSREWRIIHIISHHMLTNTIADLQAYFLMPVVNFWPEKKSAIVKYGTRIYTPLIVWPLIYPYWSVAKTHKLLMRVLNGERIRLTDVLPFFLPLAMCLFGGQHVLWTLLMWELIVSTGSFTQFIITSTGTHFHPDIFIDGDEPRPEEERDWGLNQLDTIADRYEVTGNSFLVLITFGDHALHHLFPTLDHGILHHLYPVVEETIKKFNVKIRMTTQLSMFTGYFRRVAREYPNPIPPGLKGR